MRRIETYWEFHSPDAIGLLDQITPTLRMFHKSNHEREHGKQDQAIDLEREKNGKSVKMFLSKGVEIIVYAKTDTRIRFEVVLKPNRQSGLIEGGYTALTSNILYKKLLQCKETSASKLNHLLAFLREHREGSSKQRANSIHYLSQWFQLLGHSEASIHLLNKLKSTGLIIGGKSLSADQSKMLRKAKDKGLLYKDASAGGYYPSNVHSCS